MQKLFNRERFCFIIFFSIILTNSNPIFCQWDDPDLYKAIEEISNFIAYDSIYLSVLELNHLDAVDSLFDHTVSYYNGDISEALLALTFTTVPFHKMPLSIPLLSIPIDLPLPSGNAASAEIKSQNLPSHFLFDSPAGKFGDKDKLAHFFGSAFLSYNISFFNFSEFIGIFIELFEESFKVQGGLSRRDLMVNKLGIMFGECLTISREIRPSEILRLYSFFNLKLIM